MASIDIFCTVGKDMDEYVSFFKSTCELLKSNKHNINYYCIGMEGCDSAPDGFHYIVSKREDCKHDSLTHTTCLHESFDKLKSDYIIFADIDIAILLKDWDDIIINIIDDGYACTGFQYRHHAFPSVVFFACKKQLVKDGLVDFRPKLNKKNERVRYKIKDKEEASLFGKDVGATVICDSGWRLPLLIRGNGYEGKNMELKYGNYKDSQLPFNDNSEKEFCLDGTNYRRMVEFHLDNNVFGTHLKGARHTKFDDKFAIVWRNRIKKLFFDKYKIEI